MTVDLMTELAMEWLTGWQHAQQGRTGQLVALVLGRTEWDGGRSHQAAQCGTQLKIYKLLFLEFSI